MVLFINYKAEFKSPPYRLTVELFCFPLVLDCYGVASSALIKCAGRNFYIVILDDSSLWNTIPSSGSCFSLSLGILLLLFS